MTQKYTTENGVRKYNPAYVPTATATAVPFINQSTALPVIPAPNAPSLEEEEIVVVPTTSYEAAVVAYHEAEPEIYLGGYQGEGDSLDELNQVLAKYEVPAGMLGKLLEVNQFETMELIVDDSGSMNCGTDALDPHGKRMTRWWEAKWRISQMVELLAYVPSPPMDIRFLNRRDVLRLERNSGELPIDFIQRAESILLNAFRSNPSGTTPAREAIHASIYNRNVGKKVMRFFMGDGVPNGGKAACKQIRDDIINRPDPKNNPFTFMSCTNQDDQVEWMKTTEEKAPYCSEFDDYPDESREVLKDQGNAFPYSYGLHLVAQIVAAFNPHDLDAMDESVPFTKPVLDNLLGYQSSPEEYRYYFDSFIAAQKKLPLKQFQRAFVGELPSLYNQFLEAAAATDIPAAARYKQQVKQASSQQMTPQQRNVTSTTTSDCCIIL